MRNSRLLPCNIYDMNRIWLRDLHVALYSQHEESFQTGLFQTKDNANTLLCSIDHMETRILVPCSCAHLKTFARPWGEVATPSYNIRRRDSSIMSHKKSTAPVIRRQDLSPWQPARDEFMSTSKANGRPRAPIRSAHGNLSRAQRKQWTASESQHGIWISPNAQSLISCGWPRSLPERCTRDAALGGPPQLGRTMHLGRAAIPQSGAGSRDAARSALLGRQRAHARSEDRPQN